MTSRTFLAWIVLIVLALLQLAALTLPSLLALAAPGAPVPSVIAAGMLHGTPPLALAAAVAAAVLLGTPAALCLWRLRLWGFAAGLVIAPLWLAAGLVSHGQGIEPLVVLLASHAAQGLAIGTICGLLGLQAVDIGVLRAAWCCGVAPMDAVRRVLLPLIAPGVLAGAILAALASLGASLSGLLRGPLLPVADLQMAPPPLLLGTLAVAVVVAALTGAGVVLLRRA